MPVGGTLLVRDPAGTLRAFANACRHRGTRLVDKPCATKAFVCPYHGWTYDLDGALLHVPHADAFAGAEVGRDLIELPVERAPRPGLARPRRRRMSARSHAISRRSVPSDW